MVALTGGGAIVFAWLVIGISLASIVLRVSGAVGARSAPTPAAFARNAAFAAAGLVVFGWLFAASDRDARRYATDPSCAAAAVVAAAGACTREPVVVTEAYATSGRYARRYVDLETRDGATVEVVAELGRHDPRFLALERGRASDATAERYRGTVVRVFTPAGSFETVESPEIGRQRFGMLAIACGCFATAMLVRAALV